ncbi:MAG: hypothetical protein AB7N24_17110 [Dehalococcoidia bacterium]
MSEGLRLTEILTTSSAVANYLGAPVIRPSHLLKAIDILLGTASLDDLGRPLSPLVSRVAKAGDAVAPEVQKLAQRWFAALGSDALAQFDDETLLRFMREVRAVDVETNG